MSGLQSINFMADVLGFTNPDYMRYSKRHRNPDVFSYDHSIDYKEDFGLIPESFCDCGCKSSIYTKEEWTGDGYDTEFKTQVEYEELPNQPKPTKEQIELQTDIIRTERKEEKLGIIHNQESCCMIPVPQLVLNEDLINKDAQEVSEE